MTRMEEQDGTGARDLVPLGLRSLPAPPATGGWRYGADIGWRYGADIGWRYGADVRRWRSHCPRPGSASTFPSSRTTSPRLTVNRGQPCTSWPS
jgi:hypothetical protein